jgi:hypothetical protein
VTPEHIRYGYEALDRNMQVIKQNQPYNANKDVQQASRRESLAVNEKKIKAQTCLWKCKNAAIKRSNVSKLKSS